MIKLALSFLLGVVLFQTCRNLPGGYYLLFFPFIAILWLKFPKTSPLLFILIGFFWAHIFANQQLNPSLSAELEGKDLKITGIIQQVVVQEPGYTKFIFNVNHDSLDRWQRRIPEKLQLNWYRSKDLIQEKQTCNVHVRLKKHWGLANPGGVDYEKSMFVKGIGARGYVVKGECMRAEFNQQSIFAKRERWVNQFLQYSQKFNHAHLMQSLTYGYRENIQQSDWQVLRDTGTSHLLAISGLHMSAIAFVVFLLVKNLCRLSAKVCNLIPAQSVAAIIAMTATFYYAYLAGFSLPTQRALIMVFVGLAAILLHRQVLNTSVLASALLIVLVVNPLAVLTAGFWMSFSAVLFILIAVKTCHGKSKLWQIIFIQIYLGLALFPISLLFFSQASLIAPIVNLIAIPVISFIILPLLLIAQTAFLIGLSLANDLFLLIDWLLKWFWWALEYCAYFKYSSWQFMPTILGVLSFELGLLLFVQVRSMPGKHLAYPLLAGLFLLKQTPLKPGQVRVTMLDVGQGLSVVVETPDYKMVYDAGMRTPSGFSIGRSVIAPYLKWRGIKQIDLAVISHNDNDHSGGMHWLLNNFTVGKLMVSNQPELYHHDRIELCRSDDTWQVKEVTFRILHPPDKWQSNDNNRSCVLQISHPSGTILLTGDIEKSAEQWLVDQYGDKLASDLITAPHHGSRSSSSYRFVDRVHPQTVVFSAGYRNRYGFPHATIRQRYESLGTQIVDTIQQGAVTFLLDVDQADLGVQWLSGYRVVNKHYWHSTTEEMTDPTELE